MTDFEASILQACERGEFRLALELTRSGLAVEPDSGRLWELQGLICYSLERFTQGVSAFERATILKPLSASARILLAQCYGLTGRVRLAIDLLAEQLRQPDLSVGHYLQIANACDELSHPELAVRAARLATQIDNGNAQAYYDLGYYSERCGSPPHVTECLARKAISLQPENMHYLVGLAAFLLRQHRPADAYQLVRHFTAVQISQICCRCCLERMEQLYEQYADYERLSLCRSRQFDLRQRAESEETE